jgi:hypothetical protein
MRIPALSPGARRQRHARQAGELREKALEFPHELEIALDERFRGAGMRRREPREPRHLLIDPGVVLHRARAEGIQAVLDTEIQTRESREMPRDIDLRHFGLAFDRPPQKLGRYRKCLLHVQGRQRIARLTRPGTLEDQRLVAGLHAIFASSAA